MFRLLLFLYLTAFVSAQETMIRETFDPKTDTHVEVIALFTKPSVGGYLPVRVNAANNLSGNRSINLDFESTNGYSDGTRARSSFRFEVPSGKIFTRDILVPLAPPSKGSGDALVVTQLSGGFGTAANSINAASDPAQPSILLSEPLFTPNASTLDADFSAKFSSSYGGSPSFGSKFDAKQLPDDWRAFSGYDSILMTDLDWSNASPAARNGILSWLHLGGQLVIYTTSSSTGASLGITETGSGNLVIKPVSGDLKLDSADTVEQVTTRNANQPQRLSATSEFDNTWPLQKEFGTRSFRYELFIIVLVVFGILVGPVNLFVFAKSGQRHRLFITTPLISLGASVVLIALIIFQDGFGGSGQRLVLMEVSGETGQNAAYIQQQQFSRSGVLTRSNFTIADSATFSPVPIADSPWARFSDSGKTSGNFSLQPVDGKLNASGDWFQSRSEQGHILTAVIPTRGRIESTGTANTLVSTFDYPIEKLYFLDADNQWHAAESISAGKQFSLQPVAPEIMVRRLNEISALFTSRQQTQLVRLRDRTGHFIALTNAAPAIETHPGIDWKKTRTVITGPVINP